ncbi:MULTISPECIES: protein-glutamate methylesterase/protein-glutamine glutaminase [Methylosinus]|uniref:Protein-glutamate methylesterase/protein-glutamine glutaminase n=1 Tax=Methylosinus trichosporium (strain ATCC 35070 / NCIMB 11131 / UNIQEM 75 / OB3b) TaxID=595536 RepID=A0A2D2D4C8_METT3|nr:MULTISPECIES: chemotaxis response regulator protein-glutamate methylesterase [Methylosinus]ATQ69847.1 chemotaxis response regulator protein-glutamate methylesterase [Methylosinus trichosporium OB3b]OBS52353.1 chemotaxis response regulator protein-glutamate methylesterase [Methylosinus sp. 3S-1]
MSIRVLIVDDSATMRGLIAATLRRDAAIQVVGEAADPLQARQAIKDLDPDVVTLDVEMPNMNGLEFLEKIMRLRPTRVIMVSTMTDKGASATIKALEIGAFDCVAKPSPKDPRTFEALPAKIKAVASAPLPRGEPARAQPAAQRATPAFKPDGRLVAIGASTGGVEALLTVLSEFPENCPPTVITQHMPPVFTASFAARLDRMCKPRVTEAVDGAPLRPGHVYVAPGGHTHLTVDKSGGLHCRLTTADAVNGHRPSIDVLFNSVAEAAGKRSLGVILTGMGRDGAEGLLTMRRSGAETIGQDEGTSLVYGMPRAAYEIGSVGKQLPLHRIGAHIVISTNQQG